MAIINGHFDARNAPAHAAQTPRLASNLGLAPLYATIDVAWAPFAGFLSPSPRARPYPVWF